MSKIKKLAAIMLSMVMLVCVFSVTAGAESIYDTAKAISSGKTYSITVSSWENADYKITASKAGDLKISVTSQNESYNVYVFDSNGNNVKVTDKTATSGWAHTYDYETRGNGEWNDTVERFVGTFTFAIQKGTYYIRMYRGYSGNGKISFSATYPTSSSSSSSAKISYLSASISKGSTLQLGAVLTAESGTSVTWSSSKTSVATVSSKGKITAKAAGTAIITAKLGSSSVKIKIKVT